MTEAKRCMYSIEGPKIGRHVVAWRKYCKNRTTHESGRCHLHRGRWEASNA
jgi:hypothetical protein